MFALRRRGWRVLLVLLAGTGLLMIVLPHLLDVDPTRVIRAGQVLDQWREFLKLHSSLLHLTIHGLTYGCLIWKWERLVAWVDRCRAGRGYVPLSIRERRRLAVTVLLACGIYEGLLLLHYWT